MSVLSFFRSFFLSFPLFCFIFAVSFSVSLFLFFIILIFCCPVFGLGAAFVPVVFRVISGWGPHPSVRCGRSIFHLPDRMSRLNPHGASLHVMRDASLNCEFAIPPELAARIRAENAARAARHRSRVPPTAEEEAAAAVEDGLEVLQVQLPPRRVDDISSAHSDPASEAVGGADTAVADSLDTAAAADGWAEETVDEKLPQAALLAATNTIGSKVIDGTEEGGATKAAAVNNDADDAADSDSDSEEDVHWDADDTSPESFAIKDAAALAAKLKAAKEYDAGPRDPDEPVLVVDPAAIMDEGAELDEAEMQEFQEGMAASLARDCDAATESLFARFAEVAI